MSSKVVDLDRFNPLAYQQDFIDAFEDEKFKRFILVWPRRAGKDICCWNMIIRAALRRVGNYHYVFPTYSDCRKALWDNIDIQGRRVIEYYLPEELVESRNEMLMRFKLRNGSTIQLVGSDDGESLVGTNSAGVVFSEFAKMSRKSWELVVPILRASGGWACFATTVRGRNFFFEFFHKLQKDKEWYTEYKTIVDTGHIALDVIERDIENGSISRDMALQEYFNDWNRGLIGSLYGEYIEIMRQEGRLTSVPWDRSTLVNTAWDLGYSDKTTIVFFTYDGNTIKVIDYYENSKKGLEHYAKVVREKPYSYNKHIAPHDIAVHDLSTGVSRWKMMHDLGITFIKWEGSLVRLDDGIEAVRRILPKMWIDERNCDQLIRALENYRQEYDEVNQIYRVKPVHDWTSHAADAVRMLAINLPKLGSSASAEEIRSRYNQVRYGNNYNDPFHGWRNL